MNSDEKLLNQLQKQIPSPWGTVRLDGFTHQYAKAYINKHKPNLVFISYGETDDFAHDGDYEAYLKSTKNTDALVYLNSRGKRVFYHTDEDVVMTSKGELWALPGKGFAGSYIVLPERYGNEVPKGALGICTDYAIKYKDMYK